MGVASGSRGRVKLPQRRVESAASTRAPREWGRRRRRAADARGPSCSPSWGCPGPSGAGFLGDHRRADAALEGGRAVALHPAREVRGDVLLVERRRARGVEHVAAHPVAHDAEARARGLALDPAVARAAGRVHLRFVHGVDAHAVERVPRSRAASRSRARSGSAPGRRRSRAPPGAGRGWSTSGAAGPASRARSSPAAPAPRRRAASPRRGARRRRSRSARPRARWRAAPSGDALRERHLEARAVGSEAPGVEGAATLSPAIAAAVAEVRAEVGAVGLVDGRARSRRTCGRAARSRAKARRGRSSPGASSAP